MNDFLYLDTLNPHQKDAVMHTGSPLLIIAGAGSGKTRVITTKIAYLIQKHNTPPQSILALTFTKKAAQEMQDRAVSLEAKSQKSFIRTFHSFGAWFLRAFSTEAGISSNFVVYDDTDSTTLVKKAAQDTGLVITKQEAKGYANEIAKAKDYYIFPESENLFEIDSSKQFFDIYSAYQQRLSKTGNVDFGDLIMLPIKLLRQNSKIKGYINYRFRVIMVDEYQDTNVAQYLLLKELYSKKNDTYICVVGDDDQSIYKFRGAKVENILSFQEQFPVTQVIKLEENYRSTSQILQQANAVITHNTQRLAKTLRSVRGGGKDCVLVFLPDQEAEGEFCATLIQNAQKKGVAYSNWAITYRTNAQSLGFESVFARNKIPYKIVGALKFFDREEVKDVLCFLSLIANTKDEIAFRRIVNKPPRGVGSVTQDKIIQSVFGSTPVYSDIIQACKNEKKLLSFSKKTAPLLKEFSVLIQNLQNMLPRQLQNTSISDTLLDTLENTQGQNSKQQKNDNKKRLSFLLECIIKQSGLEAFYSKQDKENGTQKVENMTELANSAALYPLSVAGLLEFLDHVNLEKNLSPKEQDIFDAVTLITLHNTKGLEFPRVIITGLENGIFPRNENNTEEISEERRLMYVGITRAKDELYFTSCAVRRMYYGQTSYMTPSVFLKELDRQQLKILGDVPEEFLSVNESKYQIGAKVYNQDFGYGYITKVQSDNKNTPDKPCVITVQFENGGQQIFLSEYHKDCLDFVE